MKFSLDKNHSYHFEKEGMIEFASLVSDKGLAEVNGAIDSLLLQQTGLRQVASGSDCDAAMAVGRDLWRRSASLSQLVCRASWADIIQQLMLQRTVRLGYDQLLLAPANYEEYIASPEQRSYLSISEPRTLEEISCIQGLFAAMILCLQPPQSVGRSDVEPNPFCALAGNGVVIAADVLVDWSQRLLERPAGRYLLITYCGENSVYVSAPADPNQHSLRNLGLSFGDRLHERSHPILKRT